MPLLLIPIVLLFAFAALVLLWPLGLWLRYRSGSARRLGNAWLAGFNARLLMLSTGLFLLASALAGTWVGGAFAHALGGLLAGVLVALAGLRATRFERTAAGLHYTPNRALVLALTWLVAARVLLAGWQFWRRWHGEPVDPGEPVWWWQLLTEPAGLFAAAGLLLGYHVAYARGLSARIRRVTGG
ncbi:DUF1453 domain-containing protein [Luteimonas sp. SJ-92]|uniref:DUF1453 domain-containing protein n=1 Tax=Luteimonas salinisoli TaxID=2752307 RepID=A0A853J8T7_9GAMM|nr:DUF1453 domain-containing protein [Luteimonas salinisoli]NZA25606.1 DUF1453 domain-containing protein [Luteimonas salinisoli]